MFLTKPQLSTTQQSETNWIISDISFLYEGDFLGQVRCPDSILFQIFVWTTVTVTESNTNETQGELVCLCSTNIKYNRCRQLIWDENPQIWHWIPRNWETTVAEEHTHADVQSLAHLYTMYTVPLDAQLTLQVVACQRGWYWPSKLMHILLQQLLAQFAIYYMTKPLFWLRCVHVLNVLLGSQC